MDTWTCTRFALKFQAVPVSIAARSHVDAAWTHGHCSTVPRVTHKGDSALIFNHFSYLA
jgi:hypothetical protein